MSLPKRSVQVLAERIANPSCDAVTERCLALIEIKHKDTGQVLHRVQGTTLLGAVLRGLDLAGADLVGSDLRKSLSQ